MREGVGLEGRCGVLVFTRWQQTVSLPAGAEGLGMGAACPWWGLQESAGLGLSLQVSARGEGSGPTQAEPTYRLSRVEPPSVYHQSPH